ncbi:MAG: hypothetical protein JRJ09_08015 [Deltaproteobacteria bacterium]|nr:hypothetical protein [Deltaproteobacteria bacterium]MBW2048459.1 hypothetical protein [Deltaproteobacteria bacterium]MBW2111234.1 hypothetical protein [Deltaproteobacteria bacterium]MBW2353102.1 hypothetical protein [Deltaproteobacteria bacterium]HDZ91320.1 hypothetical protein [Deltaproteobacteria bacterium]
MGSKVLVIISTGENEKALTGLMYASRALSEGWMDEVRVLFFGPSERLLVEDEMIARTAREIGAAGKGIACKFISDREGISEKIADMGLQVEYVGTIISDFLKDGYVPMVF